jgi:polyisoprenoid-binding protein YceI
LPNGTVNATGMVPIKMTDFGIKPPTAMFGTLRTGDEVKVNFALTVGPKAIAAAIDKAVNDK